jgi:hypothetical protein
MHLGRPVSLFRESIADRDRSVVASAGELDGLRRVTEAVAIHPATTMNESDDWQRLLAVSFLRQIHIHHLLRVLIASVRMIEPHFHRALLGSLMSFLLLRGEILAVGGGDKQTGEKKGLHGAHETPFQG